MPVKVVRTELKRLVNPTYSDFPWICTACKHENTGEVRDVILGQYKREKIGPMKHEEKCEKCGSIHELRLVME